MILNKSLVAADPFEKHLLTLKRKKKWGLRAIGFALLLTSMVDMFSMLVVFLLQTFSTSPEIMINKGLKLPDSYTSAQVREAPVVAINKDGNIYLDSKLVGKTIRIVKEPTDLLVKLDTMKKNWAKSHAGVVFPGEINLQADQEIPSTTVSMLMGILTSGQFQSIQLAVMGTR